MHTPGEVRVAIVLGIAAALVACKGSGPVGGTWTGTTQTGSDSVPIELVLADDGGSVSGTVAVTFKAGAAPVQADTLTGTRTGDNVKLAGLSGVSFDLDRSGHTLSGTVAFPAIVDGGAAATANVQVTQ